MKLRNILDINQFTIMMREGKKSPRSSCIWFDDCVAQVILWICQDSTTTSDDLHEKAENYIRNYLAIHPELSSVNGDDLVNEIFSKFCMGK